MSSYKKHRKHLIKFGAETGLYDGEDSPRLLNDLSILEDDGMLLTDAQYDRYVKDGKAILFTETD